MMNRSALKTYAPKARLSFIQAVTDRAAFFGLTPDRTEPMQETGDVVIIGGRAFPKAVAQQRRALEGRIQRKGFDQVLEAMAYTWFNRFVALRYMELHGYLDHGYRVLSHPEGKATPEIVEHAEHVTLPGLDAKEVVNLKLDGTKEAELYRLLLVAQCNALHEAMPFLFEKIADDTELLLPDNLMHSDSIIRKLVNQIEEADWQEVEIIGWIYQFYISDRKDEVIGKVVKSEDIPAATQLFTPNWIVKYLVQNTLGRQWLATYPDSPLRQQMEYYIEPAAQTDDVQAQLAAIIPKSLDPETLTLLDPASGSGHILVEAYDLFKAIYQERGYRSKDIPRLILQKNLFGLEIDDRAAQLAAFALLMKARADDRQTFIDHIQPNVIAIQESKGMENLLRPDPVAAKGDGELPFADSDLFPQTEKQLTLTKVNQESSLAAIEPCLRELIKLFDHGKTFGSLIRVPTEMGAQLPAARQSIEVMIAKGQLWEHRTATWLLPLVRQAELLSRNYDAVVTNPPYMGGKFYNQLIKTFVGKFYEVGRGDLYGCFVERTLELAYDKGFVGLITIPNWMFISTFEELRHKLIAASSIDSFIHNGRGVWGADFGSCSFSIRKSRIAGCRGVYKRLFEKQGSVSTNEELRDRFFECHTFAISSDDFVQIPGSPVAYWIGDHVRHVFRDSSTMGEVAETAVGLFTCDNERFLRTWWELCSDSIGFSLIDRDSAVKSGKKYFPYNKGGGFRRWYGLNYLVVQFERDGLAIREHRKKSGQSYSLPGEQYYFRKGITWSGLTSSINSFRFSDQGFLFESNKGQMLFSKDDLLVLGMLNSKCCQFFVQLINPTVSLQSNEIKKIPYCKTSNDEQIRANVRELVELSRSDWDDSETSWAFKRPRIMRDGKRANVRRSCKEVEVECETNSKKAIDLEQQNNELFIEAFGLSNDLTKYITAQEITLAPADSQQEMRRLISYAIGCMMGRYSLDKPGLVYAHSRNEGFDSSQYRTFPADADGIIPITELSWFPDDATERFVEFIGKTWPGEHLEENLKFITDSLGENRDEHPRDTIRRYLSQIFYKDHLQTYKRRPIYWLFSSGKQKAFQCLVYLHRYHEGTLARMRTEYVIPLQGKMSHRIEQLAGDIVAAASTSHRRKLEKERESLVKQRTELASFDEKLRHYADQRIALDLDDGVKVNYGKFDDLLAEVKAVTGGTEE